MTEQERAFYQLLDGGYATFRPADLEIQKFTRCEFDPVRYDDGLPFSVMQGAWSGVMFLNDDRAGVWFRFFNHPAGEVKPVTGLVLIDVEGCLT